MTSHTDWKAVVAHAETIVRSYNTGVTLRQLFYRLVSDMTLSNTINSYKGLSRETAKARRGDGFPDLLDRTRKIHRKGFFSGLDEARTWLAAAYRRDRTEGQDTSIYLGVEKNGIVEQLDAWFSDLGIPILALGGYASQSYADMVRDYVDCDERAAVLIYAGDFDPTGEDIDRDFVERADCFDKVIRIALNSEQVTSYNLPPQPGKTTDSRASQFIARHGELVQVELDALPPDVLQGLYQEAIDNFWDTSMYENVLAKEDAERRSLEDAINS
ncbi:MAG: hypothetical protein M3P18_02885 [Actinomycetota bacterium]|nr:hypothetical protein [Actinomycetota bacterium]